MKIFLIGFMGSGKTTIGKKIAADLGYRFIDMDGYIEKEQRCSIPGIFRSRGEAAFRKMETKALKDIIKMKPDIVLATGGGTPCFHGNMKKMNENGLTVYLKTTRSELFRRLRQSKMKRPLISKLTSVQIKKFIKTQIKLREPFFMQARIIFPVRKYKTVSGLLSVYCGQTVECSKSPPTQSQKPLSVIL